MELGASASAPQLQEDRWAPPSSPLRPASRSARKKPVSREAKVGHRDFSRVIHPRCTPRPPRIGGPGDWSRRLSAPCARIGPGDPPANPFVARHRGPPRRAPVSPPQGPCPALRPEEPPQAKARVGVSGGGSCPSSGLASVRTTNPWSGPGQGKRRGGGAWAGGAEEEAPGPGAPAGRGGKTAERRDREGTGPEEGPPPSAWLLTSLSIATACARAYVRA